MRVAVVAGEASGDLLGGGLIEALRSRVPDLQVEGVAGPMMRDAGCAVIAESEELAVMGLVEPLRHLPRLLRLRRTLRERWSETPPDVVVGIDAPDFNLGLERSLRERGVTTVHYVSPSVWAWRQGRVRTIGRSADLVLCLLPFEQAFYARHGVAAEFVGHPLADRVPRNTDRQSVREQLGIAGSPVVTVMPGSRISEVSRLGPAFIETARQLQLRFPGIRFVTPLANERTRALFTQQLASAGLEKSFTLLLRDSEAALIAGDAVLLASGTAALEAALLGRATVAAYKLAPLTYWIARLFKLVKVRHFTLPNQLTDEPLVPEFLQAQANPQVLAAAVGALLDDERRRRDIEQTFLALRDRLARNASDRAAEAILALVRARSAA